MKKKDGRRSFKVGKKKRPCRSSQMEGLWQELKHIFGDSLGDSNGVDPGFEWVKKSDTQSIRSAQLASRCTFRDACIARNLLEQQTGNVCAGPDFCEILVKLEEGALTE